MKSSSLRRQMLRIGRTAGQSSRGGRTRFLAILFATLALALAAAAFVTTAATYEGRADRGAARAVRTQPGEKDIALYARYWDQYRGRQFTVNVVSPLTEDAPLPPGIRQWPAPGTALVSPALAHGPATEDFLHRWGEPAGVIGPEGLASPGERLVWVRPTEEMAKTATLVPITGFGGPSGGGGDLVIVQPSWEMHLLIAVLLAAPALAFAFVAARTASAARDQRDALLRTLGAGPAARLWMDLGSVLTPVASGALLGAAAGATLMITDVRLPWIDYVVSAADMRDAAPVLLAATLASAPLMYGIILLQRPLAARRGRSTRPTAARGGVLRKIAVAAFPLLLLLVFASHSLLGDRRRGTLLYLVAVTAVWIVVPSVLGWLFLRLSPGLVRAARKTGDPAPLIAIRTLTARPGGLIRLVASLVIGIGLIGQAQVIGSAMASVSANLDQLDTHDGQTMAAIQASPRAHLTGGFLSHLPAGAHAVSYGHNSDSSARIIQAPCPDLKALGLPCPGPGTTAKVVYGDLDDRFRRLNFQFFGPTPAEVRTGPLAKLGPNHSLWLTIFTAPDKPLDIPGVKRAAHRELSTKANVLTLSEATGSSFDLAYQSRWVPFLSVLGSVIIFGSILASSFAEFLDVGRALSPLAMLSGDDRIFRRAAGWFLGVPLAVAGFIGIGVYVLLALPAVEPAQGITVSGSLMATALGVSAATALAAWRLGGRTAARLASSWRPRAD